MQENKITDEDRMAFAKLGRMFGSEGGKQAARNMTRKQRIARAKKASQVAAENRRKRSQCE